MRFLHTSDWHLGRTLHGASLADAQAVAVDFIVDTAIDRGVAAVIIAGDVFDRAVPPVESLRLLNGAIGRLDDAGIVTILSAGNHDSGDRLAMYSGLLRDTVHIFGSLDRVGDSVTLHDQHGPVVFYPLPYLEPDFARDALAGEGEPLERSHAAVMEAALDRIAEGPSAPGSRTVLIGHAFVADVSRAPETSDSERDLTIGGIAVIPAEAFEGRGIEYVALGHLHRSQTVRDAAPRIHYSGSLLRYSFSEAMHEKSITIVELGPPGTDPGMQTLAVPQPRGMRRLRGTIDDLLSDSFADAREDFVELVVTDALYPDRMHARLDAVYPYALRKEHAPQLAGHGGVEDQPAPRTRGRDPVDVMLDFLARVTDAEPDPESARIVREAYEAVRAEGG